MSSLITRTGFNLSDVVRDVLTESNEAEPSALASDVLKRIPQKHYRDVLRMLLAGYVGDIIRDKRRTVSPPNNPSAKVLAIRESWRRHLKDRWHVGDGEWKLTEDLTYDDFLVIAKERREIAAANIEVAEWAEKRAAEMQEAGAERFGDLPEAVQVKALGGST